MATILFIEDEELARVTMRRMLEAGGHRALEAANGRQALALFDTESVDLVVTDIIMPTQDGIETIIRLRQRAPAVRIIAVSGGGRTANGEFLGVAASVGADATLAKPFSATQLLDTVRGCLVS